MPREKKNWGSHHWCTSTVHCADGSTTYHSVNRQWIVTSTESRSVKRLKIYSQALVVCRDFWWAACVFCVGGLKKVLKRIQPEDRRCSGIRPLIFGSLPPSKRPVGSLAVKIYTMTVKLTMIPPLQLMDESYFWKLRWKITINKQSMTMNQRNSPYENPAARDNYNWIELGLLRWQTEDLVVSIPGEITCMTKPRAPWSLGHLIFSWVHSVEYTRSSHSRVRETC